MEWSPGALILDVQGVGYQLFIPDGYDGSIVKLGGELSLFVHTHVREDAIQLYGFASREELSMFETLLGVSGVGPRLALAIVAHLRPEALARAVMEGEERALTKIPGVGKKTAARMRLGAEGQGERDGSPLGRDGGRGTPGGGFACFARGRAPGRGAGGLGLFRRGGQRHGAAGGGSCRGGGRRGADQGRTEAA